MSLENRVRLAILVVIVLTIAGVVLIDFNIRTNNENECNKLGGHLTHNSKFCITNDGRIINSY